ncbi:MAG: hypothetical protein HZC47_10505 [Methanobacterium sp.]|uniref:hypothetical protein n=1 Tax=Methanobacterium sp. TaxID=2164 RepID=UPI003D65A682|nr:hypothetical protein [Methanobacterium sp.]
MKTRYYLLIFILFIVAIIAFAASLQPSELSQTRFNKEIYPSVLDYNKTKSLEISNITIKGKAVVFVDTLSQAYLYRGTSGETYYFHVKNETNTYVNLNSNETMTFFILVNYNTELYATGNYYNPQLLDSGPAYFYRPVADFIIVYWPENKIVGWKRVYGPKEGLPKEIHSRKIITSLGLVGWIKSLPGYTEMLWVGTTFGNDGELTPNNFTIPN